MFTKKVIIFTKNVDIFTENVNISPIKGPFKGIENIISR